MHPRLIDTRRLLDEALAGLDPGAASRRPAPDRWSIAEIVEHLALAYEGTVKGVQRSVAAGATSATPPSWRQRLFKGLIVGVGYFPTGAEAPKHVVPKGVGLDEALARADAGLAAMDEALAAASAQFGADVPLTNHPILGAFSADDWRRFHQVHTRHHARQIHTRR